MKKIESLTKAQEALFPKYVEKWTRIGLETAPAKRKEAEEGIVEAYAAAGLTPPKIVWCDSPISMALTRAIVLASGDKIGASVGDSVWDSVRASVRASVGDSVRASVGDSVRASVGASGYGQHDAHWIGFYNYFRGVGKLETETEKLEGLRKITENAGWFLPHKGICWISERHCIVLQDANKRLHCETGPAVKYPDGWSLHYWHGIKIPGWIVENPEQITVEKIDAESNAEVRRVMLVKYGMARYLGERGATEIDKDRDTKGERKLYSLVDKMGKIKLIKLENSTPEKDGSKKFYTFRVHPEVKTCQEAVAYLYSMEPRKYQPSIES